MISLRILQYLIYLTCVYCDYLLHVSHVVLFLSPYNTILIDPLLILIQLHNTESNPIWFEFMLCICFLPNIYYYIYVHVYVEYHVDMYI